MISLAERMPKRPRTAGNEAINGQAPLVAMGVPRVTAEFEALAS